MAFLPDWMSVVATMLAIAVFVTGRLRLASVLVVPALLRFVFLPTVVDLLHGVPAVLRMVVFVVLAVLAFPVIVVRAARRVFIVLVGTRAADYAIGRALGRALIHLFERRRY